MTPEWSELLRYLLHQVRQSEKGTKATYSFEKLLGLTRYLFPVATEEVNGDMRAALLIGEDSAWEALFAAIPEADRKKITEQCLKDMSSEFPKRSKMMASKLKAINSGLASPSRRKENIEKFNRYLKHIDYAILKGRYYLALKLSNRILKEYYRYYLKKYKKTYDFKKEDLTLMSIWVCRYMVQYFRQYRIPYMERRVLFITTVTNVLFTTMRRADSSRQYAVDRAIAIYARNNANRIIRYLVKYI
jgi:hypothetical protein